MYPKWKDENECIQDVGMGWKLINPRWKDRREYFQDERMGVKVSKMEGWE